MSALAELAQLLATGRELTVEDVHAVVPSLADPAVDAAAKAGFLRALADKGETPSEVAAFAQAFRARAVDPGVSAWSAEAVDIVGTGGDKVGAFNISSLVVLTLASAGVKVMKHGNRGITSKCGSADLLAALGVDLEAPPEKVRAGLAELGFAFFFAPAYHPTFRHIAPARKLLAEEGRRSIFNILGPLINPGRPAHILLGSFAERWVPLLAEVLDLLGTEAGLAAHCVLGPDRGIDEFTTAGPNRVRGIGRLREVDGTWSPAEIGLPLSPVEDLIGGDLPTNLAIVDRLLDGRGPQGLVDTIVANTSLALWVCGRTVAPAEGVALAREQLLGGAVRERIARTREFFKS
ncbi:MAG: anthranilate phosphoribosyltransferase [Verrucomicrobiota bacterium]